MGKGEGKGLGKGLGKGGFFNKQQSVRPRPPPAPRPPQGSRGEAERGCLRAPPGSAGGDPGWGGGRDTGVGRKLSQGVSQAPDTSSYPPALP